jgi:hypothetical protein
METQEKRLNRLQSGSPREALLTLINSQGNWFVDRELKPAMERGSHNLLILGIHTIAETWAEILFPARNSLDSFRRYLEHFVDGDDPDKKFSEIAVEINRWRNILAHQWLSSFGHVFGVDLEMSEGWKREGEILYFNPLVYFQCFIENFDRSLTIIEEMFTEEEREEIKRRIIERYLRR